MKLKIPRKDAYLISKIYGDFTTAGGTPNTTVLTTANVLSVFDELMTEMDEKTFQQWEEFFTALLELRNY